MNDKNTEQERRELSPEELDKAAGGSFISGGEMREANCPSFHANAFPTGQKREVPFLFFWKRRQREYRCPDCGYVWWKDGD